MPRLSLVIPLVLIVLYLLLAISLLARHLGQGPGWRTRFRAVADLGPGEVIRRTYISALLLLIGAFVLLLSLSANQTYLAYRMAPACGEIVSAECRALLQLEVSRTEAQSSKSGNETVVYFGSRYGNATFYQDDLPLAAVPAGSTVTAEVWRGEVTALEIEGTKHQSFATQSDAWVGIVAGVAMILLGITWLATDLVVASMNPSIDRAHDRFVSPVNRRNVLYVLLPVFGVLLVLFGLAYVNLAIGAISNAETLVGLYFVGGLITLPALIITFAFWFVRAYLNVGALGLRIRHSAWFVLAALLVPPLSLYMPYRLAEELTTKIQAPVMPALIRAWWACGIGWLGLTLVAGTIGSSDPTNTSIENQLSNAMFVASVLVGIAGVVLTLRLIDAIDVTQADLARRMRG